MSTLLLLTLLRRPSDSTPTSLTLSDHILDLVNAIGSDHKTTQSFLNNLVGNLQALATNQKGSVVLALNEVHAMAQSASGEGGTINDSTPTSFTAYSSNRINQVVSSLINDVALGSISVWSSDRISAAVDAAVEELVGTSPETLNTIQELADALGSAESITTINAMLAKQVRVDISNQSLTDAEKLNARLNIDVYGSVEFGDPAFDLVSAYISAKS